MPSTENYITQSAADARYQALGGLGSTTPTTVDAGDTGTAGVSSSASRQDHEHPVSVTSAQLVPSAWLAAWTSYTPTLTQSGAVTKTVTYAKYIQMGKTVIVNVRLDVTGAGSASNAVSITLPVTASSYTGVCGSGFIYDASATIVYAGVAKLESTTTASLYGSSAAADSNGNPLGVIVFSAALASPDQVTMHLIYEAA